MTKARMLLLEDDAALAELIAFHFQREDCQHRNHEQRRTRKPQQQTLNKGC